MVKIITSYRMSLHDRILDATMEAFAKNGIKAVKMDDIAQELSISKRTLYELFENKEVLLYEGLKRYKERKTQEIQTLLHSGHNVMDIILAMCKQKVEEFRNASPLFYTDLQRYPRVLSYLEQDKETARRRLAEFLQRGVQEGFFRSDINHELVAHMFNALTHYVLSESLYNAYTIEQIIQNLMFVALRGICTQKGIKVLDGFTTTSL